MTDLREIVLSAAARPEVVEAVQRIYDTLQQAIDSRRPRCDASGRCCRFEEFGHRLYVTTIELAAFVAQQEPGELGDWDGKGCPFQIERLCSVHAIRPFGCRIFFCDPSAQAWQQEQYADFHRQIKQLHETLGVPYIYVEWRQALRIVEAGHAPPSAPGPVRANQGEACLAPTLRPTPVARTLNLLTTRPPG